MQNEDNTKIRKHKKKYEDVYSNKKKLEKCNFKLVSTDIGLSADQYLMKMRKTVRRSEISFFDNLVKYSWLVRHFHYRKIHRSNYRQNGFILDSAFGIFMKHYVGTDKILFSGRGIARVLSYVDEFFPNFQNEDPFKKKFIYPFKHIGLGYLIVVFEMKNRMEFLKYAEKHKLRYTEFLDYVINYIYCMNENSDKAIYFWKYTAFNMPFVKVIDKKFKKDESTFGLNFKKGHI